MLALLKEALEDVGLTVFVTDRVEQAAAEFYAADFDLIAFGRGVDEPLNTELRAVFSNQRSDVLFVNGLAPVVPLLVKQILFAMRRKPEVKNVLSDFRYQIAEPITVVVTLTEPTQLTVGIYQLDAEHRTVCKMLVSEFVQAGQHAFPMSIEPDAGATIRFLTAEVDSGELSVLPIS
ncbi:hypothetical protein HNV11_22470 [Spirosoma taeanense]|uniref:Uncharacterized protein n=1 Tax=Spirosoma taeanense TaxID=2735870 RepID=A0A6M5YD82_9BACT|nr:hypothetical protein [Spirosoma taeanense]QJW91949.1 hypothetical protein HNV11_22470 [Spirosoma taeanense]